MTTHQHEGTFDDCPRCTSVPVPTDPQVLAEARLDHEMDQWHDCPECGQYLTRDVRCDHCQDAYRGDMDDLEAAADAAECGTQPVPEHLRNAPMPTPPPMPLAELGF